MQLTLGTQGAGTQSLRATVLDLAVYNGVLSNDDLESLEALRIETTAEAMARQNASVPQRFCLSDPGTGRFLALGEGNVSWTRSREERCTLAREDQAPLGFKLRGVKSNRYLALGQDGVLRSVPAAQSGPDAVFRSVLPRTTRRAFQVLSHGGWVGREGAASPLSSPARRGDGSLLLPPRLPEDRQLQVASPYAPPEVRLPAALHLVAQARIEWPDRWLTAPGGELTTADEEAGDWETARSARSLFRRVYPVPGRKDVVALENVQSGARLGVAGRRRRIGPTTPGVATELIPARVESHLVGLKDSVDGFWLTSNSNRSSTQSAVEDTGAPSDLAAVYTWRPVAVDLSLRVVGSEAIQRLPSGPFVLFNHGEGAFYSSARSREGAPLWLDEPRNADLLTPTASGGAVTLATTGGEGFGVTATGELTPSATTLHPVAFEDGFFAFQSPSGHWAARSGSGPKTNLGVLPEQIHEAILWLVREWAEPYVAE